MYAPVHVARLDWDISSDVVAPMTLRRCLESDASRNSFACLYLVEGAEVHWTVGEIITKLLFAPSTQGTRLVARVLIETDG